MAWRVAIFNRLIHPDFLHAMVTEKQLAEIGWYYERHPFGHDVDHRVMARVSAAVMQSQGAQGVDENKYMPRIDDSPILEEMSDEMQVAALPGGDGALKFLESISGNH